jgi:hypothetical protein
MADRWLSQLADLPAFAKTEGTNYNLRPVDLLPHMFNF